MTPDQQPPYRPSDWTPNPAYRIPDDAAPQSPAVPQPAPYGPLIRPTSGMATASMVFGIAGLLLFCTVIPSLVAVLCGHSALAETKQGHKAGHGQAVAGLILGYLVLIPAIVAGVIWLMGLITNW